MRLDKETAIVVLEAGEPAGPEGVEIFLRQMLSDREANPLPLMKRPFRKMLVETELASGADGYRSRFADIGVDSPLQRVCGAQADGIAEILGCEGYVGMLHGEPSIPFSVSLMLQEGIKRAILLPMDPHPSSTVAQLVSTGFANAWRAAGMPEDDLLVVDAWNTDGHLRRVCASHYSESLRAFPEDGAVIFLARDPGAAALIRDRSCMDRVSEQFASLSAELGLSDRSRLAWLPAPINRSDAGPTAFEVIAEEAERGAAAVALVPLGWSSDRFETLAGLDIDCGRAVRSHKLRLYRLPTINDRPEFLVAMAAHINRCRKGQAA